jgi:hypothetical protein
LGTEEEDDVEQVDEITDFMKLDLMIREDDAGCLSHRRHSLLTSDDDSIEHCCSGGSTEFG